MAWPEKPKREELEINGFIEAYKCLTDGRHLEIVEKSEKPDYVVQDKQSGKKYGVELTSVYLNDRSVPDEHIKKIEGVVAIPHNEVKLEKYKDRLVLAVIEKVCKARKGYNSIHPLILAIYANEYIGIHLDKTAFEELEGKNKTVFDDITPFTEIVFWSFGSIDAHLVRRS
ncbi:MAG: hypothetical protein Dbin4_02337 [Alphaproteobacteria bacterium]|nr:hypothetical protein [Alphaproteobacteria bacterium]